MSTNDNYAGVVPIHNSELPLFISQPTNNVEDTAYVIIMSIAVIPFIVTDLYFAFNDNSCVDYPDNNIHIQLKEYLIVSGYSGIFGIISAIICNYYESIIFKPKLVPVLKIIYILFNLIWTLIGAIIFWGIMDNMNCGNSIYTYVTALIIMKFIWFAYTLTKLVF